RSTAMSRPMMEEIDGGTGTRRSFVLPLGPAGDSADFVLRHRPRSHRFCDLDGQPVRGRHLTALRSSERLGDVAAPCPSGKTTALVIPDGRAARETLPG